MAGVSFVGGGQEAEVVQCLDGVRGGTAPRDGARGALFLSSGGLTRDVPLSLPSLCVLVTDWWSRGQNPSFHAGASCPFLPSWPPPGRRGCPGQAPSQPARSQRLGSELAASLPAFPSLPAGGKEDLINAGTLAQVPFSRP